MYKLEDRRVHIITPDDFKRYKNPLAKSFYRENESFRVVNIDDKPFFVRTEIVRCLYSYVRSDMNRFFVDPQRHCITTNPYPIAHARGTIVHDEFVTINALKLIADKEFGFDDWKEDIEKFIAFLQNTVLPEFYAEHSKALQIFNNNEILGENTIRAIMIDGEPYFVAVDICNALDIQNPRRVVSEMLDDDEKLQVDRQVLTNGVVNTVRNNDSISDAVCKPSKINPMINLVTLPGLIQIIFLSRKLEAKQFKRWLAHEVLPTLYRTGSYSMIHKQKAGDD